MFPSQIYEATIIRLAVWGLALSCKRMIPSDRISGRFQFMAHHQSPRNEPLFFACLYFQCWTNTLYTTLTSRAIKKQLCGPVRFHYACLLPYGWQYRYVTTVLPTLARIVFYDGGSVLILLPLIHAMFLNCSNLFSCNI